MRIGYSTWPTFGYETCPSVNVKNGNTSNNTV